MGSKRTHTTKFDFAGLHIVTETRYESEKEIEIASDWLTLDAYDMYDGLAVVKIGMPGTVVVNVEQMKALRDGLDQMIEQAEAKANA